MLAHVSVLFLPAFRTSENVFRTLRSKNIQNRPDQTRITETETTNRGGAGQPRHPTNPDGWMDGDGFSSSLQLFCRLTPCCSTVQFYWHLLTDLFLNMPVPHKLVGSCRVLFFFTLQLIWILYRSTTSLNLVILKLFYSVIFLVWWRVSLLVLRRWFYLQF